MSKTSLVSYLAEPITFETSLVSYFVEAVTFLAAYGFESA